VARSPARRRSSRSTSTTGSSSRPRSSAPPTRSTRATEDAVEKIREYTGGFGADVVVEAVGRPETYEQAFFARDLAGTVVLVGVPTPDKEITLPLIEIFGRGGALKSSWYGDCLPSRDFPMLVDLYKQGRFDLGAFVTEKIGIGDVEAAFAKMHDGDVLRSVVVLD
jgi:S-(hydroxymethyl)mycothiol dehydrogenase